MRLEQGPCASLRHRSAHLSTNSMPLLSDNPILRKPGLLTTGQVTQVKVRLGSMSGASLRLLSTRITGRKSNQWIYRVRHIQNENTFSWNSRTYSYDEGKDYKILSISTFGNCRRLPELPKTHHSSVIYVLGWEVKIEPSCCRREWAGP